MPKENENKINAPKKSSLLFCSVLLIIAANDIQIKSLNTIHKRVAHNVPDLRRNGRPVVRPDAGVPVGRAAPTAFWSPE